eukprot:1293680-Prymnesium_polylepis.1
MLGRSPTPSDKGPPSGQGPQLRASGRRGQRHCGTGDSLPFSIEARALSVEPSLRAHLSLTERCGALSRALIERWSTSTSTARSLLDTSQSHRSPSPLSNLKVRDRVPQIERSSSQSERSDSRATPRAAEGEASARKRARRRSHDVDEPRESLEDEKHAVFGVLSNLWTAL